MKILATGTAGMLGSALVPELLRSGHDVTATDLEVSTTDLAAFECHQLDVRSRDQIEHWIERTHPDLVVHLAAETDLEKCELDPDGAWLTNALGTKFVALACRNAGIQMAYVSTAGVFDGENEQPYTEFDRANPINYYGRSKYAGELFVQNLLPESYIARAGWMVGGGKKDHKFVAKILNQLSDGATTIYAVNDKFGSPTYAPDFAKCFEQLIGSRSYGLYHMVSQGRCSRFDVTLEILKILGRSDVEVVPVDSSYFATDFFAPRPPSEAMRNLILDLQGMNTMRPWETALADYLAHDFADQIARGATC